MQLEFKVCTARGGLQQGCVVRIVIDVQDRDGGWSQDRCAACASLVPVFRAKSVLVHHQHTAPRESSQWKRNQGQLLTQQTATIPLLDKWSNGNSQLFIWR